MRYLTVYSYMFMVYRLPWHRPFTTAMLLARGGCPPSRTTSPPPSDSRSRRTARPLPFRSCRAMRPSISSSRSASASSCYPRAKSCLWTRTPGSRRLLSSHCPCSETRSNLLCSRILLIKPSVICIERVSFAAAQGSILSP